MRLLCLGDIAINNSLSGVNWAPPTEQIPGDDFRIIFNWELPIGAEINTVPRVRGPRLLSSPDSPNLIKKWSPGFATLATNHVLDGGISGLTDTIMELEKRGFATIGAGLDEDQIGRPVFWETREGRLGIINWVFAETHPEWMSVPGPNCWPGLDRAAEIIHSVKNQVDWLMIVVHWSDELFPYPRPEDREIGRSLAGFGADLIVGHHPHVVRGMEFFGTCPVFYSLGNFYFSEFSDRKCRGNVRSAPRNREGLGIEFTFQRGKEITYQTHSFWYTIEQSIQDQQRRAARRMKQMTKPLLKYRDDDYTAWYARKRSLFDRLGNRWHFGVLRRGFIGSISFLIKKYLTYTKIKQ